MLALIGACANPPDDPPEQAPEPIGPPLKSMVGGRGGCSGGIHLYRAGQKIQAQCFDRDDNFVYDNQATLTAEASTRLDAEVAAADLDDTEPVDWLGFCGEGFDAPIIETLWVGEQSITFEIFCLIRGIVPLYEYIHAIEVEFAECGKVSPDLLETIEPGCQIVF
jgi:hypothetical protein